MTIDELQTNESVFRELGKRIHDLRLDRNVSQDELAKKAGISLSTLKNLEKGNEVKLGVLLNVLRALGILANVDSLIPEYHLHPMEAFALQQKGIVKRKRASRQQPAKKTGWKWGDEK